MSDLRGEKEIVEDYENVLVSFLLSERIPNLRMILQDPDREKNFSIVASFMTLKDDYSLQVKMILRLSRLGAPFCLFIQQ